jgi:hypothetical protein
VSLRIAPVRQKVSSLEVEDVSAAVRAGLADLPLTGRVRPGMRVALAVGSRGIAGIHGVVKTLVDELVKIGAHPFCVPAMGSHGGGTAEGQRAVLEGYGLGERDLGVPVRSSLEVFEAGTTPDGMPVFFSVDAAQADAIVLVNRIKEHTAFKARYESGLLKLLAVGLGKARGAAEIHRWGIETALPAAGELLLERFPVVFGVGIVENGHHAPARIAVIPGERLLLEEPALLDLARSLAPKIPFDPLDLLVVRQIGKDISGTGMDLNVIGMWRRNGGPVRPDIRLIGALELTENSHGNGIGMGHADLITHGLLERVDLQATYLNCLTSQNLAGAKIPITLSTDRELFATALAGLDPAAARVVILQNTLELEYFWAAEGLLEEVGALPHLEKLGPARELQFTAQGKLDLPPAACMASASTD